MRREVWWTMAVVAVVVAYRASNTASAPKQIVTRTKVVSRVVVRPETTLVQPPILNGSPFQGQKLVIITRQVGNAPTWYTYQWWRDGVVIQGASGSSYVLTSRDVGHRIQTWVRISTTDTSLSSTTRRSGRIQIPPACAPAVKQIVSHVPADISGQPKNFEAIPQPLPESLKQHLSALQVLVVGDPLQSQWDQAFTQIKKKKAQNKGDDPGVLGLLAGLESKECP